jgi:hypothetical protein
MAQKLRTRGVDESHIPRQRRPRVLDDKHLAWLRTLPCQLDGHVPNVEAAHIRYEDPRFGKRFTGLGEKPSDKFALPLSADRHRLAKDAQHRDAERAFWRRVGIDPCAVAAALFMHSGDDDVAHIILSAHREGARPG